MNRPAEAKGPFKVEGSTSSFAWNSGIGERTYKGLTLARWKKRRAKGGPQLGAATGVRARGELFRKVWDGPDRGPPIPKDEDLAGSGIPG